MSTFDEGLNAPDGAGCSLTEGAAFLDQTARLGS